MTKHVLKSWPEFFEPIFKEAKNFELRKNDRHYKVGDVLVLREWEPTRNEYSGRKCTRTVIYRLDGIGPGGITPLHGLSQGYCVLGLE